MRARLLRRGFALEYVTLGWNVAGIVVLAIAAVASTFGRAGRVWEIFGPRTPAIRVRRGAGIFACQAGET